MLPTISDFVPEIVCLGVDCVICGILYTAYSFTNRAIISVSTAPSFDLEKKPHDIESFRNEIISHPNATINTEGEKCVPYAVIRGNIQPASKSLEPNIGNPDVDSKSLGLKHLEGVIRQFAITEHKKTMSRTGFWVDSERVIHEYTNHVPFFIVPQGLTTKGIFASKLSNTNCRKVDVIDWSDAAILDLDVTRDSFETAPNSLSDNVWGWIVGDRPKGIQTTEKMLLNGTTLTAIGELAISKDTGDIKIQVPSTGENYYLVKDTAKGLIKDLEKNSRIIRNTLFVFGGIGAIIVSIAIYRYMRRLRIQREAQRVRIELEEIVEARQERNRNLENRPSISQPTMSSSNATSNEFANNSLPNNHINNDLESDSSVVAAPTCIVCLTEQREVILMNCGHVCVCASCAMEIMATRPLCPVCRADIIRVSPAYIA